MRIRNIIIILSTFISLLTIGGLYFIQTAINGLLADLLEDSSRQLFERQTQNLLMQRLKMTEQQAKRSFLKGKLQMTSVNMMLQLIEQGAIYSEVPPYDCLDNPEARDSYAYSSSFCYMFCNKTQINMQSHSTYLNLTALQTQYHMIFDFTRTTYLTDSSYSQLFNVNAGNGKNLAGFMVHTRPWYINQVYNYTQNKIDSQFSDPYYTLGKVIAVSQTQVLSYVNGTLSGVIGQDIILANFMQMDNSNISVIVVNSSGTIIFGPHYTSGVSQFYNIDNTTLTGFTIADWQLIKGMAGNTIKPYVEVFNSDLNQTVIVSSIKLPNPQYYIVMFSVYAQITQDKQLVDDYILEYQGQYEQQLVWFGLVMALIIILQISCVIVMLQPINLITSHVQQQMCDELKPSRFNIYLKSMHSGTVDRLLQAYFSLIHDHHRSRRSRSAVKLMIDQFQYPIRLYHKKIHFNIFRIMNRSNKYLDIQLLIRKFSQNNGPNIH